MHTRPGLALDHDQLAEASYPPSSLTPHKLASQMEKRRVSQVQRPPASQSEWTGLRGGTGPGGRALWPGREAGGHQSCPCPPTVRGSLLQAPCRRRGRVVSQLRDQVGVVGGLKRCGSQASAPAPPLQSPGWGLPGASAQVTQLQAGLRGRLGGRRSPWWGLCPWARGGAVWARGVQSSAMKMPPLCPWASPVSSASWGS